MIKRFSQAKLLAYSELLYQNETETDENRRVRKKCKGVGGWGRAITTVIILSAPIFRLFAIVSTARK